jgi:hypothetical protein
MTVILATQETEIRRIAVQSRPEANTLKDSISIKPIAVRWVRVPA